MLYFGKTGMILGFSRAFLIRNHARLSMLMALLICIHFALNLRLLRAELKKLFRPRSVSPASSEDDGKDK